MNIVKKTQRESQTQSIKNVCIYYELRVPVNQIETVH